MNLRFLLITVAAGVLLAATPSAWALPPRQHSVNGVVEAIDCATRTITLKSKDGVEPLSFVWTDDTRFTSKGGCAKCGLKAGQSARLSYRREVGRNVLREVSTKGGPSQCAGSSNQGQP